ncbi:hypothetical protein Tco_1024396 [Tanacetum coccineum]
MFLQLDQCDLSLLEAAFTLEEVKEAVWACSSVKSPGPDGFNFKFIKRYWDLIKFEFFSFIKEFTVERGLRQGDPLSPFLFLLVAEALQVMMIDACNKGIFKGLSLANDEVESIARSINCSHDSLPFSYLGLPVGRSMRKVEDWACVSSKFTKRLTSWKIRLLSIGGRSTLTKSVLDGEKKITWVCWNKVLSNIKDGGLGQWLNQVYRDVLPSIVSDRSRLS